MKYLALAVVFSAGYLLAPAADRRPAAVPAPPPNPGIDMPGYLKVARTAAAHREARRVTEAEFVRMSGEKGTVVLDARSKEMYDRLHVKGAVNLSFPDIDAVSLPRVLPDKSARVLIYCNNNFTPAAGAGPAARPADRPINRVAAEAMRPKMATASLNISTYIALYNYGYHNVYELAPLIDPAKSALAFESGPEAK